MGGDVSKEASGPYTKQQFMEEMNISSASDINIFTERDVKKISNLIWEKFGTIQRKSTSQPNDVSWNVIVDIGEYGGKRVTADLYISITCMLKSFINEDEYPYVISNLPKLEGNLLSVTFTLNDEELKMRCNTNVPQSCSNSTYSSNSSDDSE